MSHILNYSTTLNTHYNNECLDYIHEEVGKPLKINNIIRILKSQYDKRKTQSTSQEEQGFMGTSSKKVYICSNCKKKGHSIETCWSKGSGRKDNVLNKRRDPILTRKKGKKRQMQPRKAPAMENQMDQLHSSILTVSRTAQELLSSLIPVLVHI